MKRTCWPLAVLVVVLAGSELRAHHPFGLRVPGFGYGYARFGWYGGFGPALARGYGGFYGPIYPYGSTSITRIRILALPPPPPVVLQVAPLLPDDLFNPPPVTLPPYEAVMAPKPPPEEPPLPGREAGIFRPLDPDNRARARQPVRPDQPPAPPPERDRPPKKERPAGPPMRLPRPPGPRADPQRESLRLIALGKESFADQEYGRAAERFRLAGEADPTAPLPLFLLAQAQMALGKYRPAFDSIQRGLNLDPDWPARPFRPVELYGDNLADYDAHLNVLADVLAANPRDAVLLFLSGYELWFDGRREEARVLFERAAPALPDRGVVESFLRALPGVPVV